MCVCVSFGLFRFKVIILLMFVIARVCCVPADVAVCRHEQRVDGPDVCAGVRVVCCWHVRCLADVCALLGLPGWLVHEVDGLEWRALHRLSCGDVRAVGGSV